MQDITHLAFQSLLFAPAALAAPGDTRGGEGFTTKIIKARDEKTIWESRGDGNLHVRVSDKQFNFSNTKNDVVLTEIRRACTEFGCGAGGETVTVDSENVDGSWARWPSKIEAHAEGFYGKNKNDSVEKLDLLIAALIDMDEAEETTEYMYHEVVCSVPAWCEDMKFSLGSSEHDGLCKTLSGIRDAMDSAMSGNNNGFALVDIICMIVDE